MIKIDKLNFSYDEKPTIKNLSVQIDKGERIALLGRNGAGKTTLSKIISGIQKEYEGSVVVAGQDISKMTLPEVAPIVSYAFQNPDDQIFAKTVRQEIEFGPRNLKWSEEEIQKSVDESLKLTELTEYADKAPYELPYSMRKTITVASAIAMKTEVLILDEPTAGQDYVGISVLEKVLKNLEDTTIIIISHDMDFVYKNFNRILVMNEGVIISDNLKIHTLSNDELLKQASLQRPYLEQIKKIMGVDAIFDNEEEIIASLIERRYSNNE